MVFKEAGWKIIGEVNKIKKPLKDYTEYAKYLLKHIDKLKGAVYSEKEKTIDLSKLKELKFEINEIKAKSFLF